MLTWPVTWSRPNQLTQDFEFADVTAMNVSNKSHERSLASKLLKPVQTK